MRCCAAVLLYSLHQDLRHMSYILLHLMLFYPWCPARNHCHLMVAFGCRRNETRHCVSCRRNEPIEQILSRPCKHCEPRLRGDGQARGQSDQLCQEILQLLCGHFLESPRRLFCNPIHHSLAGRRYSSRENPARQRCGGLCVRKSCHCQSATKTRIRIL